MVVPRCHVSRLSVVNDAAGRRVDAVITEHGPVPVSPDAKVIIALGTIESTRLALISFGEDGRIGTNLMAHLRSNLTFRMPRQALTTLDPSVKALQASALLLKGRHAFTRPDGSPDGTLRTRHRQPAWPSGRRSVHRTRDLTQARTGISTATDRSTQLWPFRELEAVTLDHDRNRTVEPPASCLWTRPWSYRKLAAQPPGRCGLWFAWIRAGDEVIILFADVTRHSRFLVVWRHNGLLVRVTQQPSGVGFAGAVSGLPMDGQGRGCGVCGPVGLVDGEVDGGQSGEGLPFEHAVAGLPAQG
jgi:hypothetical protein